MMHHLEPTHLIQLIEQAKTFSPITVAVVDAADVSAALDPQLFAVE